MKVNRAILWAVSSVCLLLTGQLAQALVCCPGCMMLRGERLAERIARSNLVVHGRFSNPREIPDSGPDEPASLTDMKVLRVIKGHPVLDKKKEMPVAGFMPNAKDNPVEFIVFAEVKKGRIMPYDGIAYEGKDLIEYMNGSVEAQKLPIAERIGYFFKYLDHANEDIARDAYMEVSIPSYQDVASAKKYYDPDKVIAWLKDKKTQPYKIGLLGMIVGICGRKSDAPVLHELITDPEKRPYTGLDGLMAGYCLLEPEKGTKLILDFLSQKEVDFNVRYAALRITTTFLLKDFPAPDKKAIFERLGSVVDSNEIGDLVIDELRKAEVWKDAEKIFGLYDKPELKENQLIRRAVVRYAIKCPGDHAKAFIEKLKKVDPARLALEEENVRFEEAQIKAGKESETTKK